MKFTTHENDTDLTTIKDEKNNVVAFVPKNSPYAKLIIAAPDLLDEAKNTRKLLSVLKQDVPRLRTLDFLISWADNPNGSAHCSYYLATEDKGQSAP